MTSRFVIMGVAGCGKTTVGQAVAAQCGLRFIDGDDLHPAQNIEKMSQGVPLDDDDRAPWLAKVGMSLAGADGPVMIGCSALKRRYRDWIRKGAGAPVAFVHLAAEKPVIAERMGARTGHFMPTALLDSQFADLEPLEADESGVVVDIEPPFEAVVADAAAYVRGCLDG